MVSRTNNSLLMDFVLGNTDQNNTLDIYGLIHSARDFGMSQLLKAYLHIRFQGPILH